MRRLLFVVVLVALSASAQSPHERWRTIRTPHFRVHYPIAYEAWARHAAGLLEPLRDAVARETGWAAPQITDVIVGNPEASANGITYPLLDTPRIVLYAEPPDPGDQLSEFGDWTELLIAHEMTHLQHLLRPSRNGEWRLAERVLPLGPITIRAPRWVDEGYATMVEGRITGSGRPPGSLRAAVLRKWAQSGRLPTYAELSSSHRFLGMSMAYLAGSAYLEWLEARSGAGSLRKLWARMSAKQLRSFDEAFIGVFGDTPERLYGRFVAELTERAVTVDRETAADLREGTLWQETTRGTGDPAVSPDGKEIAYVVRDELGHAKLIVDATGPDKEQETKTRERIASILRNDPEDVAPVPGKPLPRKALHTLVLPLRGGIAGPRWMPDGKSILFTHRSVDASGDRHHDLYLWHIGSRGVVRVTHSADLFDGEPMPNGRSAIAVRSRYGESQLVRVDLSSGLVTPLTAPSIDVLYARPRIRDGKLLALEHAGDVWRIVVWNQISSSGELHGRFDVGTRGSVGAAEWASDGSIIASIVEGGFIELHRLGDPIRESSATIDETITRSTGGAFQPAPSPDGRIFFMALEPDGFTIRVLDKPEAVLARATPERSLVPALPPPAATPMAIAPTAIGPSHPYGFGHPEYGWMVGGSWTTSGTTTEAAARIGDVIGRFDLLAIGAAGSGDGQHGGAIAAAWRGWPIELRAQLFDSIETAHHPGEAGPLNLSDRGGELRGAWRITSETMDAGVDAGFLAARDSRAFAYAFGRRRTDRHSEFVEIAAESGAAAHRRIRGRADVNLFGIGFGLEGQHDAGRSGVAARDAILLGGSASAILPRSAFANRVLDPALDSAELIGRSYEGVTVDATIAGVTFFHREHRLGEKTDVSGAEIARRLPPMPIVKVPALRATAGVGRVLGHNRWWIGLRMEP